MGSFRKPDVHVEPAGLVHASADVPAKPQGAWAKSAPVVNPAHDACFQFDRTIWNAFVKHVSADAAVGLDAKVVTRRRRLVAVRPCACAESVLRQRVGELASGGD